MNKVDCGVIALFNAETFLRSPNLDYRTGKIDTRMDPIAYRGLIRTRLRTHYFCRLAPWLQEADIGNIMNQDNFQQNLLLTRLNLDTSVSALDDRVLDLSRTCHPCCGWQSIVVTSLVGILQRIAVTRSHWRL